MLEGSFGSPVSRCDVFLLPFNDDSWQRCYEGGDVMCVFPVFELCGLTEVGGRELGGGVGTGPDAREAIIRGDSTSARY